MPFRNFTTEQNHSFRGTYLALTRRSSTATYSMIRAFPVSGALFFLSEVVQVHSSGRLFSIIF